MNSDVHPVVVALVLFLTGVAVAIWMWGSGAAASIGGPAELRTGPDGHHYVQIQNYLVEHDADGSYLRTHDLEDLGVEIVLGTFAFFSDGDILLRRGPDPRSTWDNLRAYQRKTNEHSIEPTTPDSGLFRCDLDIQECERFGTDGVDFKAAFGVFIDRLTDDVYFSDTTRHLLRKFSADGTAVAGPIGGFKFPNQLLLHEGQLFVANTNHHVVSVVEAGDMSFGEVVERIDVVPPTAERRRQTWPSHFARVGNEWWVNNMKTGMNQGGLYVFDDGWAPVRSIELPENADPISLIAVGEEVWVSDWNNDLVRRFSVDGARLPSLESAGLDEILTRSQEQRRGYNLYKYGGIALLAFVMLALLVRAFAVGMNKAARDGSAAIADEDDPAADEVLLLEPSAVALRRLRRATIVFGLLVVTTAVMAVFILLTYDKPQLAFAIGMPVAGIVLIFLGVIWVNKANVGTSIRLDGSMLTLRDHTGRESSCPVADVRYDDTAIATRDMIVFLGRPVAQVYEREAIKEQLIPRLATAQRIGPFAMQKLFIELRHPQGFATIAALVGAAILIAMAAFTEYV